MFGKLEDVNANLKDLNMREIAYFAPLVAAAFWIGLYPSPVMKVLKEPIKHLVMQIDPHFYEGVLGDIEGEEDIDTSEHDLPPLPQHSVGHPESESGGASSDMSSVDMDEANNGGH
jgi:hypothetical protein